MNAMMSKGNYSALKSAAAALMLTFAAFGGPSSAWAGESAAPANAAVQAQGATGPGIGRPSIGKETGLPLPRFVSLKANTVNMRVGPGRKYGVRWQYRKRGLPVEVIQEFNQWRRIRDAEGSTGWVLHSLLSSRRTAVVAPWEKPVVRIGQPVKKAFFDGKSRARLDSSTIARAQAGLIVAVDECEDKWCAVEVQDRRFWLQQKALWGVYPGENVEG